jgi:aerobic-type carbon monoxide dehydrogenase small subunit (CoxS/CutS family)
MICQLIPEPTQLFAKDFMSTGKVTELLINGSRRTVEADPDRMLLSVLREDLDLTGTKYGCGEGQCGACTVLIDGLPTRSCTKKLATVGDRAIITIEGLGTPEHLHPLQQAFIDLNAMQCGYCTPGMIMAGAALLKSNPHPTEDQIVTALNHNVCRCGTYRRIVAAVQKAASQSATSTEGQR